jgi:hypothetical protein
MSDYGPTAEIDPSRPHPARMYDYYLGGNDNYAADRTAAAEVEKALPQVAVTARTNRLFMQRATRWLARDAGIDQFLDIGTGIPTPPNLHRIAQQENPEARVVYVDNDPIVLAHAQALMRGTPEGRTEYIAADVRDVGGILAAPGLRDTLDLARPVALSLNALLHFVPDEFRPYDIVRDLLDALVPGSYLVLSHCTPDFAPEAWAKVIEVYRAGGIPAQVRSRDEVERFFHGLDCVDPGLVVLHRWRPDTPPDPSITDAAVSFWAGVARKPES